jgi:dolichyldiphosphatase
MPSTHSTALSFYLFYLLPLAPLLASHLSTHLSSFLQRRVVVSPWLVRIGLGAYWIGGLWSRVRLGYHTVAQVLVGAIFGGLLAAAWRWGWELNRGWLRGSLQSVIDQVWAISGGRVFT